MVIRGNDGKLRYPATLLCLDGTRYKIDLPQPWRRFNVPKVSAKVGVGLYSSKKFTFQEFYRRPFNDLDGRRIFDEQEPT